MVRWGQSAYETDAQLIEEARRMARLGVAMRCTVAPRPDLADTDILAVTSKVRVDEALLRTAPQLQLVVTTTSGHEHIDVPACRERGVRVARSPVARRDAVVDTSLALGLSLLRCVPALHRCAEGGAWARRSLPSRSLRRVRDLVVGVIGAGVIGSVAARSWRALGAEVQVVDPAQGALGSWSEAGDWDVLTLHCDLNPTSHRIVDAERLAGLKPGVVLLNTARGDLVDVEALFDAPHVLAGLDVFPEEPPARLAELARRPGTLLLPHAAGYHDGLGAAVADELEQAVEAFVQKGELPHEVTD